MIELHASRPERTTAGFFSLICFMILGSLKPVKFVLSNLTNTSVSTSFLLGSQKKKDFFLQRCVFFLHQTNIGPIPEGERFMSLGIKFLSLCQLRWQLSNVLESIVP